MKQKKKCPECGGREIYVSVIGSGGGYAPDMLPGAHPWWKGGKMEVYVCGSCGLYQYFVPPEHLENIGRSKKFAKYW
jgi:DNA-directed RNA polymerase subunit RPC12/RpoP